MTIRLKCLLVTALLMIAASANAQVTTSAISGVVVDENKEALIGATVVAKHVPSGTSYGAATNIDGRYHIQGMRTGGPYTIEISYIGYNASQFSDVYLQLGNTTVVDAQMEPTSTALAEVVVMGKGGTQAGAAKNFSLSKIESTPTISRNVYDVVKNTPMVNANKTGGITIAGANNRFNSFQIDGAVANDVFGLSATGTNGGQTSVNPISLEAIEELQVVISPFDVRQSGFTGGGINAVTKQGGNAFHASAYTYYNNQDFYGRWNQQLGKKDPLTTQHTLTCGGNVSGAFIKDKLFFFVNVERNEESYPSTFYPGYNGSTYLTVNQAKQILDHYYELTGGKFKDSYGQREVERKSTDLLARVDWNISDKHKLALRYQHVDAFDDKYNPSASSYYFNGSQYRQNNLTNSFVLELNSRFSNDWSNELRVSYNRIRDHRDIDNQGPTMYITNVKSEDGTKNMAVNLGAEYSSSVNFVNQDIYLIEDNLTWYKGRHAVTFGTHNEIFRLSNGFIQYASGVWSYNGLDAFLNDQPNTFYFKCSDPSKTGGDLRYAPLAKVAQFGVYAQDMFDVTNNLQLSYGLRVDVPVFFNNPTTNTVFNEYSAQKGWGVKVGEMPSSKLMLSPRVGFRWYVDDEHTMLLRGGVGLFTGRIPFVWAYNAFNNSGMEQIGCTLTEGIPAVTTNTASLAEFCTAAANPDIVTLDRKMRFPQVLRANLAYEQRFGDDWKLTLEGLYSKTYNSFTFENLALTQSGKVYAVPGVEASAVPYYSVDRRFYSVINTKNASDGYSYQLSAQLQKSFAFGLDLSAAYTFGHSYSSNDGISNVAYSCWKYTYAHDVNNPSCSYSQFDIPNRVMFVANYTSPRYAAGKLQTVVGLVYNGSNSMRYSLAMNEAKDYNGDGYRGNSLLYIPTESELAQMNFASEDDRAKFGAFIEGDSYAKNHRGQYADRNSNLGKWENRVDLHIAENIFYLKNRSGKVQLTLDVLNFANLLNKKWGASYADDLWALQVLKVNSVTNSNGVATPTFSYNNQSLYANSLMSRWHMQIGCKVTF